MKTYYVCLLITLSLFIYCYICNSYSLHSDSLFQQRWTDVISKMRQMCKSSMPLQHWTNTASSIPVLIEHSLILTKCNQYFGRIFHYILHSITLWHQSDLLFRIIQSLYQATITFLIVRIANVMEFTTIRSFIRETVITFAPDVGLFVISIMIPFQNSLVRLNDKSTRGKIRDGINSSPLY